MDQLEKMMRYPVKCRQCGEADEIEKPMRARWPHCRACGGGLRRVFNSAPAVVFNAPGFYSADVARLRSQVGSERHEKFEREKADAERRAKAGRLTAYEKALEMV